MFGLALPLFTLVLSLASSRCVIRLFQLKDLQYLPDMSLVRLDRDSVATPLGDTIQDSSNVFQVRIFTYRLFLDLVVS